MSESTGLPAGFLGEQERLLERLEVGLAAVLGQALLNAVDLIQLVLSVLVGAVLVEQADRRWLELGEQRLLDGGLWCCF